ncbi:enolase C-terminal domain-like protein [Fundicoccus culcitae]|uniref:glucarate dehydratase n=1 Tax=Fundicoccus culcitae TaxID=2969821 RepID=A0ABY5P7Q1_9LACT|nr:enolase C-terminal domain-like protein [Fundicoccus culcitae]UUX34766.1 glucarate dehydratase [Fundicoccus culcitae]
MANVPKVKDMKVYPVAGHDSPTLTLSGCHAPHFTRNIVVLEDDTGEYGIGEIHGGEHITDQLKRFTQYVIGEPISEYRKVLNKIKNRHRVHVADEGEGLQKLNIANLKYVVQSEAAIECAMLDLLGKHLNQPMASLLGDLGQQRDEVEFLGYLFYSADANKIDLPYEKAPAGDLNVWENLRRTEMMTPEAIVKQASVLHDKYGFTHFKLKGGALDPKIEIDTVKQLKAAFPQGRINIDPNGAWTLEEAIELTKDLGDVLSYVEDPCGPEGSLSSREINAEYKAATGFQLATNMIATNWRQFYHALMLRSVDIVLADPHFWTLSGSIRMAYLLNDFNLTWGSHSNNHFDITLATFVQVAAAAPGHITPVDTHWIWQDGESLLKNPLVIKDGKIKVPDKPGLGVELDFDKLNRAHQLYLDSPFSDRDDTIAMQYLIPGWQYDSKRPTMVR